MTLPFTKSQLRLIRSHFELIIIFVTVKICKYWLSWFQSPTLTGTCQSRTGKVMFTNILWFKKKSAQKHGFTYSHAQTRGDRDTINISITNLAHFPTHWFFSSSSYFILHVLYVFDSYCTAEFVASALLIMIYIDYGVDNIILKFG